MWMAQTPMGCSTASALPPHGTSTTVPPTTFCGASSGAEDPFAGIGAEAYPRAWPALCALAHLRPGEGELEPVEAPAIEFTTADAPLGADRDDK